MAEWTFSDGTVLRSGGELEGESSFAVAARAVLAANEAGLPTMVDVAAPPGGLVPLDVSSDWLLDRWASGLATQARLAVKTDYEPTHAPAEVSEIRAELEASTFDPSVLY